MPLPNPGMNFTGFDPLPASDLNDLVENVEALADGTGLDDDSINTNNIVDGAVTSEKLTATIVCRAYRSSAFIATGGGGAEKLVLNSESYDPGSYWDTTNGRFTAPITGYYQVNLNISVSNSGLSEQIIPYIYVNGAPYAVSKDYGTSSTDDPSSTISDLVYVVAGQYIEPYVDCTSNVDLVASETSTYMSIYFVGAA